MRTGAKNGKPVEERRLAENHGEHRLMVPRIRDVKSVQF